MRHIKSLTLSVAAFMASLTCTAAGAPEFLIPSEQGAGVISGLSNNGKYGVSYVSPEESGFSYTIGAVFYDLTGSQPKATDLTQKYSAAGAYDVTDDGRLVVGTVDNRPAVCRYSDGKWTWEFLPIPDKTFTLVPETGDDDALPTKFKLNGGEIRAVTPDGKYAVGLTRSNEYELLEQAVMWDLTTGKIVEVDAPFWGSDGVDYHQTRFMQLSDDGNYLLCWNAFSYSGSLVFVYDRRNHEAIYIDRVENADGSFSPRVEGYYGLELDGYSKSLTSDGRYVGGGIGGGDNVYLFLFDVKERKLTVFNDGFNDDVTGWSVLKDGTVLGATPSITLYADGLACYDNFLFPFATLYSDVYGLDVENKYGIDNTGKPTLVSDDGRTIVFVTGNRTSYVLRLDEPLKEGLDRINLMSAWSASPAPGSAMNLLSNVVITFDNVIEVDASRYAEVKLTDSKGTLVANPLSNGGLQVSGNKLTISFRGRELAAGETYTLSVPSGLSWVKGRPSNVNSAFGVDYLGRANVPVEVKAISPADGSDLASLDLNDNPVVVSFDVPVRINGTADNRPIAHLYVDDSDESAASLNLDVDLTTGNLIIYPSSTVYLYRGSEYVIKVPEGAVCDISGRGPSKAFEIKFNGSYVPQIGDELYVFRSTGDDFSNFLLYEGDLGMPNEPYAGFGFTQDSTPWWVVSDENSTDMAFASHSSYVDGRQANDWLVIRQLSIPSDVTTYLSFQSQSFRKAKEDYLKVYIYEYEPVLNMLTTRIIDNIRTGGDLVYNERQNPGASEDVIAGEWTDNVVPLDKYAGKKIYIAFVNDNENQSMVMIDNIEIVKEVKAFISLSGATDVVNLQSAPVKGYVTIESDLVDYSSISMTLLDGKGEEISALSADGLSLKAGDMFAFEFPEKLPITVGEENPFTIRYTLDEDEMSFNGKIRNLAFLPEKRVVIEEYTGKTCPNCPLGIAAMERLESLYGSKIIPVILHAYGNDPKGAGIYDYASTVFPNPAAPSARINRSTEAYAPMGVGTDGKYTMTVTTMAPGSQALWQDVIADQLAQPAYLDIALEANDIGSSTSVSYTATVKSALNLEGQSVRVLGMLLEDGIRDRQMSSVWNINDPLLGEFANNGIYAKANFDYVFHNVARGYWGQSTNGTGRLIPSSLKVGEEYRIDIRYNVPLVVNDRDKMKMAVILIDENTGRIINAAVEGAINGVEEIAVDMPAEIEISQFGGEISVNAGGDFQAAVYTLDGRLLRSVYGNGSATIALDGYKGLVIVRVATASGAETRKLIL